MSKLVLISDEKIINKIYIVRRKKVMDRDLAELYGMKPKRLRSK